MLGLSKRGRAAEARSAVGVLFLAAVFSGCVPVAQNPTPPPTRPIAPPRTSIKPSACASIVAAPIADLSGEPDPVDTLVGLLRSRRLRSAGPALTAGDELQVERVGHGGVVLLRALSSTPVQAQAVCKALLPTALEVARAPLSEQLTRETRDRIVALRAAVEKKQLALWEFRLRFGPGGLNPEKRVEAADRRVVELEELLLAARRKRVPAAELSELEAQRTQATNEALESNMRATEWERLKKDAAFTQQQLDLLTQRLAETEARRLLGLWEVLDDCGPCDPPALRPPPPDPGPNSAPGI